MKGNKNMVNGMKQNDQGELKYNRTGSQNGEILSLNYYKFSSHTLLLFHVYKKINNYLL